MALAFFGDPTAPVQCAVEVATALKSKPYLKLRMGISRPGLPCSRRECQRQRGRRRDQHGATGDGMQGHRPHLVSKSVADVLLQLSQWSPYLTGLGECAVKHGVAVQVWNLASDELGNRERPRKLAPATPKKSKMPLAAALTLAAVAILAGVFWLAGGGKSSWFNQDPPSIAVLPFVNLSSEKDQERIISRTAWLKSFWMRWPRSPACAWRQEHPRSSSDKPRMPASLASS